MSQLVLKLSEQFQKNYKINIEIIDLRTISPLDRDTIIKSAKKTGKVLILDPSWKSFGASAEIMATIYENSKNSGIIVNRLYYPDSHTPASSSLEKNFI